MGIQKITPRQLSADQDERLLRSFEMIDALNVTISEDGDGSANVLKNIRGADAVSIDDSQEDNAISYSATSATTGSEQILCIGKAEDEINGDIYFFVTNKLDPPESDAHVDDAIYKYSYKTDSYFEILKDQRLGFRSDSFIKADVVNADFTRDGQIETILYFTDNVNEPRKINVQTALDGGLPSASDPNLSFERAIAVARPASLVEPTFEFITDTSISVNNFLKTSFQFATQFVYDDGEESVLSPYSKAAIPNNVGLEGFDDEEDPSSTIFLAYNVCEISVNAESGFSENLQKLPNVSFVRLYGRQTNQSSWSLIDEFDPSEDLTRALYGSDVKIYDSITNTYKFYNDNQYAAAPVELSDRSYDNVPQKAEGQAVVGGRLMYSNYVEGYPNVSDNNVSAHADMTVVYSLKPTDSVQIPASEASDVINNTYGETTIYGYVDIDILEASAFSDASDSIDDGSVFNYEFTLSGFDFNILASATNDHFAYGAVRDDDFQRYGLGFGREDNISFFAQTIPKITIKGSVVTPIDGTVADLVELIKDDINDSNYTFTANYDMNDGGGGPFLGEIVHVPSANPDPCVQVGDTISFLNGEAEVNWSVKVAQYAAAGSSAFVRLKAFPKTIKVTDLTENQASDPNASLPTAWQVGGIPGEDHYLVYARPFNDPSDYSASTYETLMTSWLAADPDLEDTIPFTNSSGLESNYPDGWNVGAAFFSQFDSRYCILFSNAVETTFKSGSTHELGVVYYDDYGRHGFVNRLGQFYVESLPERSKGQGPAKVTVNFNGSAPDWASSYKIVYPGCGSFSDFYQFRAGPAYVERIGASTVQEKNKNVYLSIKNLDKYYEEKNPIRKYSFTEGDKLRVLLRRPDNDSGDDIKVNPFLENSRVVEFNILDVVTFGADDNPLHTADNNAPERLQGRFLVLSAPEVTSNSAWPSNNKVQFRGLDWYSIADDLVGGSTIQYPNGDNPNTTPYWEKNCLVEIVTPRTSPQEIFYETGSGGICSGGTHFPSSLEVTGDAHIRKRSNYQLKYNAGWESTWSIDDDDFAYRNDFIESFWISDFWDSKTYSKGKPHTIFRAANTTRRSASITYSEQLISGETENKLSTFNPTLANFYDLDAANGSARYIGKLNDTLLAVQEERCSITAVNKNAIQYADGQESLAVSTNVLTSTLYSKGKLGCKGSPEGVTIINDAVFFVDPEKQKVVQMVGNSVVPISDNNMQSVFESLIDEHSTSEGFVGRVLSGWNSKDNIYIITIRDDNGSGKTYAYNISRGSWESRYSFVPSMYANVNNSLYTFRHRALRQVGAQDQIMYKHESESRNSFPYVTGQSSEITVVFNADPSLVKVFDSVSLETDSSLWTMDGADYLTTNLGDSGRIRDASWVEKEGMYYAPLGRDEAESAHSLIPLGELAVDTAASSVTTLEFASRVNNLPIAKGMKMAVFVGDTLTELDNAIDSWGKESISFESAVDDVLFPLTAGTRVYALVDDEVNGDPMRGNWIKVKMKHNSTSKFELYAVNMKSSDSPYHYG